MPAELKSAFDDLSIANVVTGNALTRNTTFAAGWFGGYLAGKLIFELVGDKGISTFVRKAAKYSDTVETAVKYSQRAAGALKRGFALPGKLAMAGGKRVVKGGADVLDVSRLAKGLGRYGIGVQQRIGGSFGQLDDGALAVVADIEFEVPTARFLRGSGDKGARFLSRSDDDQVRTLLRGRCASPAFAHGAAGTDLAGGCDVDAVSDDLEEFGEAIRATDDDVLGRVRKAADGLDPDLQERYSLILREAADERAHRFFAQFEESPDDLKDYLQLADQPGIDDGYLATFAKGSGTEGADFVRNLDSSGLSKTFGIATRNDVSPSELDTFVRHTGGRTTDIVGDADGNGLAKIMKLDEPNQRDLVEIAYKTELDGDSALVSDKLAGEPGKVVKILDDDTVDDFSDLKLVARDENGKVVYLESDDGWPHVLNRHIRGTERNPSADEDTFFPAGQSVTRNGETIEITDRMSRRDVKIAIRKTIENDDASGSFTYELNQYGIKTMFVNIKEGGRIGQAYPVDGEHVLRWNKDKEVWEEYDVASDQWIEKSDTSIVSAGFARTRAVGEV